MLAFTISFGSNNTNKLSPQERYVLGEAINYGSNNTNKLSPQELLHKSHSLLGCSNNTNKLSPQEQNIRSSCHITVQIIQINLVLKNL